jgi:hypothetical protein
MPYQGGVQLLPETQRRPTLASYTSGNRYFWTGIVLSLAVMVAYAVLSQYAANLNGQIASLDGQLDQTEASRNKTQEQTLLNAQQQTRIMKSLLGSKSYWTMALSRMEDMMQSSVTLSGLNADAVKGTIDFSATADSYAAVAHQLAAFAAGTGVLDVTLNSVKTAPQGGVQFNGTLTIDTKTLLHQP